MHELSVADGIVEIRPGRAGTARARLKRLEIGMLSAVLPDAVRLCFDVCARNTVVEGATLEIVEAPGRRAAAIARGRPRWFVWPAAAPRQRQPARHRWLEA